MALLWTTPDDVRGRWVGDDPFPFADGDDDTLKRLLEDAEDTVLAEFPDLPSRVGTEAGQTPPARVKKVVSRVVIRHLRNPAGERVRLDVAGPFTSNVTYGGADPGALYLTDADRAELAADDPRAAFGIDTTPAVPLNGPDAWLTYGRTWR